MVALIAIVGYFLAGDNNRRAGLFSFSSLPQLAVIEISGPIMGSDKILTLLSDMESDPQVKAVVVRIESPGGAVGSSQEIYRAIRGMSKPVVASLGNVAASGGYYIAAACDKIVCNPGTITGSIGVITTLPNLEELLNKLGIKFQTMASGPLKGAGQSDRPLNQRERAMFEGLVKELYRQFVEDVAKGRSMEIEEVMALADGGIFSGTQAVDNGLADYLGNFNDALSLAAGEAGLSQIPEIIYPQREESIWHTLGLSGLSGLANQMLGLWFDQSLPRYMLPLEAD